MSIRLIQFIRCSSQRFLAGAVDCVRLLPYHKTEKSMPTIIALPLFISKRRQCRHNWGLLRPPRVFSKNDREREREGESERQSVRKQSGIRLIYFADPAESTPSNDRGFSVCGRSKVPSLPPTANRVFQWTIVAFL